MSKCAELLDPTKCDLVVDAITARFGDFVPKVAKQPPMLHHNVEVTVRCIDCDQHYYYYLSDPKIEDFGQLWRTAVFSKQYKPETTK
jgi:hypothetical protein